MSTDISISTIVCCHNSSGRLKETIRHLGLLQIPEHVNAELLVVDNASTDNTAVRARELWEEFGTPQISFRVITEPKPGLTNARRAGIAMSNGDLILFCDDDNYLSRDYVVQLLKIFNSMPDVGIVGGLALPNFSVEKKPWLKDFFRSMAIGPQAPNDGFVTWVYGAGMAVRRSVFDEINGRHIKILLRGRVEGKHTSGEDSEICNLARFLGHKVYYNSEMILHHDTPPHRLGKRFHLRSNMPAMYENMYLFILGKLVENPKCDMTVLYWKRLIDAAKSVLHFTPRSILGKHKLYSFVSVYGNIQAIGWLLANHTEFKELHRRILKNLFP